MYDEDLKHLGALAGFIALLSCGFVLFITYQNSEKLDTDKTTINTLSSFTVKNNPNAKSDYERLAAYIPKTDKGEAFKAEKTTQKLNELRTFGTK